MDVYYKTEGEYLYLNIKAVPGSSKNCFGEISDGKLKIRVAAAPEDGKANEELRSFLSKTLKVPKRDIEIVSGEKSRIKTLRLPVSIKELIISLLPQIS